MLLRLRVTGFKNLHKVDIAFGPFTCIAGPNAAGKSNLFDAISFLSALADRPLLDAALSIRSHDNPSGDVRRLFHHAGPRRDNEMSFEAEMLVPRGAVDELGQDAIATTTFLRYHLILGYREDDSPNARLEIRREELQHIVKGEFDRHVGFDYHSDWKSSVLLGRRFAKFFISTERGDGQSYIEVHQDRGTGGRNRKIATKQLPRTVLSTANAAESPTALVARREMQSWRLLQLEPSALRSPDSFNSTDRIDEQGHHIPATLARLAKLRVRRGKASKPETDVYAQVASRLAELTEDIRSLRVDADERRELLSLVMTDLQGTEHEARALSDGTLRFLALAVLAEDPTSQGVVCLEEPENGIHPERIPAMLRLLNELAVSTARRVGPDNPLRQVIANTHSPAVVSQVYEDSLVLVRSVRQRIGPRLTPIATFRWLPETWRAEMDPRHQIAPGELAAYFNPASVSLRQRLITTSKKRGRHRRRPRRVADRPDVRQLLLFPKLSAPPGS